MAHLFSIFKGILSQHDDIDEFRKADRTISCLTYGEWNALIGMMSEQLSVDEVAPKYAIYKIDAIAKRACHYLDVEGKIGDMFHTSLSGSGNTIILNCMHVVSLMQYVAINKHRYVFIPVAINTYAKQDGHICMLIFDNTYNKVYFADPNGVLGFPLDL